MKLKNFFIPIATAVLLLQLTHLHPTKTYFELLALPQYGVLEQLSGERPYDSLVFVGDVMMARNVERLMQLHGSNYPFAEHELKDAGRHVGVIGNFEASIPPTHTRTPAYTMSFSVAEEYVPALVEAGFTHLSLANNHSFDKGVEGHLHTKKVLDENNITSFGGQYLLDGTSVTYLETTAGTVALIGINNTVKDWSSSELQTVFTEANSNSDLQIAYVHWGNEYQNKHSANQRNFATKLVETGADLIIGHHPHVVQDIATIEGVPVVYSLGNYVFDQYFSTAVQEGLVLQVDFTGEEATIKLSGVSSIGSLSQPQAMTTIEQTRFLSRMSYRSAYELQNNIRGGELSFNLPVASSLKMAMMNR